ncbi:MAG: hypothetical protein M3076_04510 [Actinomycetota bacterium]|nr:hypothetical protein [Actinomycetota bacterium]
MLERLKLRQGQEALVWATAQGAQAAGLGVPVLRRAPAPTTWEHHLAVGWVAAWLTVGGRPLLGSRELGADERWSGQIYWSERQQGRESRHRPDLVAVDDTQQTLAVEVELTVKSRARTKAVLDMYGRSRAIDGVIYVAADQLVARHIRRAQKQSTLDPSTLSVRLLSDLREQAVCTPRQPFSAPSLVQHTVNVTQEELEMQKAVERHIAARKREREREEEERRAVQQREQRA